MSRGSDIMVIDGHSIAAKGEKPVEGISAEAIVPADQSEKALNAGFAPLANPWTAGSRCATGTGWR